MYIQVLTQSRPHIIQKTFEAIKGAKNVVVHLYNSTSFAQRQQVFRMAEDEIVDIAVSGAKLFNEYADKMPETNFRFEYSPESFTGTEVEFALRICNAVIDVWQPRPERKVIINLPSTVEMSMPHVYAQQIEYMSKHLHSRGERHCLHPPPTTTGAPPWPPGELALLAGGTAHRGHPLRQWGAHRQRGHRHHGHEPVHPRGGPEAGLLGHAQDGEIL